jgi:hypothetical protein
MKEAFKGLKVQKFQRLDFVSGAWKQSFDFEVVALLQYFLSLFACPKSNQKRHPGSITP